MAPHPLPVIYEELPASIYTDPDAFDDELEQVFGSQWLVACHLSEVPPTGARAEIIAGQSIVITRQHDCVRAFHNVCSHRAAELVDGRCEGMRMRCGFHGWTYGLDGSLIAVPGRMRFGAGLDVTQCSLPAVRAEVWGGLVWVRFDEGPESVADWLGDYAGELQRYEMDRQRVFGTRHDPVALNWKACVDAFNETYHVGFIHRDTVGRLVDSTHSWFTYTGRHSRGVIPVQRSLAEATGRRHGAAAHASGKDLLAEQANDHCNYTLFPNVILNTLPTWGILLQFDPIDVGQSVLRTWMLADATDSPRREHAFEEQWQEFNKVMEEDLHFLGTVSRGLRSTRARTLRFGGEEEKIVRFHHVIAELRADAAK